MGASDHLPRNNTMPRDITQNMQATSLIIINEFRSRARRPPFKGEKGVINKQILIPASKYCHTFMNGRKYGLTPAWIKVADRTSNFGFTLI